MKYKLNRITKRLSGGGGSGMWDGAGSFIPVPSNANNIQVSTANAGVSSLYIVQAVLTR